MFGTGTATTTKQVTSAADRAPCSSPKARVLVRSPTKPARDDQQERESRDRARLLRVIWP
jgi:hypothetical protein